MTIGWYITCERYRSWPSQAKYSTLLPMEAATARREQFQLKQLQQYMWSTNYRNLEHYWSPCGRTYHRSSRRIPSKATPPERPIHININSSCFLHHNLPQNPWIFNFLVPNDRYEMGLSDQSQIFAHLYVKWSLRPVSCPGAIFDHAQLIFMTKGILLFFDKYPHSRHLCFFAYFPS